MTAAYIVAFLTPLLVTFMTIIGVWFKARMERKQIEQAQAIEAHPSKVPDYKRIAYLEREQEIPIELVAKRAAQVAENYWNNPGLLYAQHPHVRDYGWPKPVSFDWSLCHCPVEIRTVVADQRLGSSERRFTCSDCGKPIQ